ncbi:AsmA family protein, partial [archaeon]|nr:AsmA family protein [archaeon]
QLDLPSVLQPELAAQGWIKGLGQVRPVKLVVTLAGYFQETAVQKIDLQAGTLASSEVRLSGSVENLQARRGLDLDFAVRGNEFARLNKIIAQPYIFAPVPGQGAYAISGKVSDPSVGHYEVKNFKFALADNKLTGRMRFNPAAQPPQYEVTLSAPQFNMKPFPIPKEKAYSKLNRIDNLGPLKIRSKVIVADDRLSLPLLDLQAGSTKLAAVRVKGSIKDLTNQRGIDLHFDIRDLALTLGATQISGRLDLNPSGKQLQLAAELTSPKFNLQPVTWSAVEPLSRIEDLGPLKLKFNLVGIGDKLALDNLDVTAGSEKIVALMVKGKVGDLTAFRGMDLGFTIRSRNISKLIADWSMEIPSNGALGFSGQFVDPAPRVYKLSALDAAWGDSRAGGWLELDNSGKRPRLKVELTSDKLDLRPFLGHLQNSGPADTQSRAGVSSPKNEPEPDTTAATSGSRKDRVFSPAPLPLTGLQTVDAELKFRGRQVLMRVLAFNDVVADILLQDGNLDIHPFNFKIGGGNAEGRINLKSQKKPAELTTKLTIDRLAIGPMLDQLGYPRSVEGDLDAIVDLEGSGDSIAALMADLNGDIRIAMIDGKAESRYLEMLSKYLGSGILRMLNPFEGQRQYTPINCFVDTVEIDNGKADVKLLLDTDQTSIFGAGDIDLKTEKLNLGIKPTPKKGDLPANISFSLNELSQPFRLGGTLANPHLAIDPGRTAFVLGKFAGALALGPIGIAAFFADISIGKKDPCSVALEKAMPKDPASGGQPAEETPQKPAADAEEPEPETSGGFFRRLFGK